MSMRGALGISLMVGVPGSLATGFYFLYDKCFPRTFGDWLFWSSDKLSDDLKDYKSVFADYKEEIKEKGIEDATALQTWCTNIFGEQYESKRIDEYYRFRKYCFRKTKTIRGFLIAYEERDDFSKDITDDEYKTMFAVQKYSYSFLGKWRGTENISSSTNNEEGKEKLKKWCEGKLSSKLPSSSMPKSTIDLILDVSFVCRPLSYSTVKEKLEDEKGEIMTDVNDFKTRFKTQKYVSDFLTQINKGKNQGEQLSSSTGEETGGPQLKTWCESSMEKKLSDEGVYNALYNQVKHACTKKKSSTPTRLNPSTPQPN